MLRVNLALQLCCSVLLVPLAGRQVHKLVKFRTTAMVVRGAVESFKPPINADERGCSPVPSASIGAHRRFLSRRYEAHSLSIGKHFGPVPQPCGPPLRPE